MARRVEVSFTYPNNKECFLCSLYHLPSYNFIRIAEYKYIYQVLTENQRKKLEKLKNNRDLEITLNIKLANLICEINKATFLK